MTRFHRGGLLLFALLLNAAISGADPRTPLGDKRSGASSTQHLVPSRSKPSPPEAAVPWCAPELQQLSAHVCFYTPAKAKAPLDARGEKTLVIFLHSLISAAPRAAWDLQRRMARMADGYDFSMLVPRGRPALGPGRAKDILAWPTALPLQRQYEEELLAEWKAAQQQAEALAGPFQRVLLFGFSNGAYYATSLAFRDRFRVDGVAAFAGGSGSKYMRLCAARAQHRVPFFLGYGTKDPDHQRQQQLAQLLKQLSWPRRVVAAPVGHTVSDRQLREALSFHGHIKPTQD